MVTLLLELVPCLPVGAPLGRALPARPVLGITVLALATVPLWKQRLHSLPPGSSGWAP